MLKLNKLKMGALIIALVVCGNVAFACPSDEVGSEQTAKVQSDGSVNGNS